MVAFTCTVILLGAVCTSWQHALSLLRRIFNSGDQSALRGLRAVSRLAERLTFASADLVISTGESYRTIALRRGGKRPDEVHVVRSAPELARFCAGEGDCRYRRGRRYLVGYLGVMGPQEGLDHLLRAAGVIVHDMGRDDVSFVLIGGGIALDSLRALADELGLDGYVEFTGRVPDDELVNRLCTADVCVNPDPKNAFNDACVMNKILEYMSLGRPVVQYDLTEGRRSAGDASLYARPNDYHDLAVKIVELLDDEPRRLHMGQVALKRMTEELEWRYQAPKLLAAYEQALRGHRRRSCIHSP